MWLLSLRWSFVISLLAWVFAGMCLLGLVLVDSKQWLHLQDSWSLWEALAILPLEAKLLFWIEFRTHVSFFLCLFYVLESVMLSILWLCQLSVAFGHIFQPNGHLTWHFTKKLETFRALGQLTRSWLWILLTSSPRVDLISGLFEKWILLNLKKKNLYFHVTCPKKEIIKKYLIIHQASFKHKSMQTSLNSRYCD